MKRSYSPQKTVLYEMTLDELAEMVNSGTYPFGGHTGRVLDNDDTVTVLFELAPREAAIISLMECDFTREAAEGILSDLSDYAARNRAREFAPVADPGV